MNYFKDFKIPCLQTFDELKQICRDNNLRLKIPNSTEKNFRELIRLKCERDKLENQLEYQLKIKRQRDELENQIEYQSKIKRLKASTSSDEENHDHNYSKQVEIVDLTSSDKLIENHNINPILDNHLSTKNLNNLSTQNLDNLSIKNLDHNLSIKNLDHNLSIKNLDDNLSIKNLDHNLSTENLDNLSIKNLDHNLLIKKSDNHFSVELIKKRLLSENLNNRLIIENLDNRSKIENLMCFYAKLNNYAFNLNKQLIKFKNEPITIENKVDQEMPPNFNYVNQYCLKSLDEKTLETIKSTVHRCDCKYDCIEFKGSVNSGCCYSKLSEDRCFYNSNGLIKSTVIKRGPIIECTEFCKCGEKCPNRIIQNGTKVKLAIFKTSDGRGWGLKALEKINKNKFICTYRGEIVTSEEAIKRQAIHSEKYFFDLDYDENLQFEYVIDATNTASLGRFLNHSCYANCETFMAYVENCYIKMPVIAFFTNRQIKANEELTIDYFMGNEYKISDEKINNRIGCLCKSATCRNYSFC